MFFVFYFIMTGLHAAPHDRLASACCRCHAAPHLAGQHLPPNITLPLRLAGLYWHFVDIVWVFLYAIFYIPGLH